MNNKLFVGNISWNATSDQLKELFETVGAVVEAVIIMDKVTGRSRGFGFVTMESEEDAQKALEELNGKELDGRPINVKIAEERE